ncbi:MAG: archaeosine biosynthesis radical SAM protein RaSEA [Candidatus Methanomethylophilaceae archaeon]|nr:archaeosine biosynthesis radical SAM protein RaSEA [Candidatus Methanomethylophilaceae archaeon]MDD3379292.1 archaeosine biosynthesis radical SAM protein RaSEA [Candidatus Methanomethylophilaceae archaeon]MDY0224891.1 archaeosine biosynthesis radical SAM protein RaSEA [Candidatus Methanomethylophilaceae archaeon]
MKEKRSPSQLETLWKEKDLVNGKISDTLVMIMRTSGCCWAKTGGCTMCGYRQASISSITEDDLNRQIDQALSKYEGEPFVKIYTSGSFLDEKEIPISIRDRIFDEFSDCGRILVESRPEFVTNDVLSTLPRSLTIALGLESSNPDILRTSINKGFTEQDSKRAGMAIKDAGLTVRTYLLLKPLFITESKAIEDSVNSARFADPFSDEISVNPINVQRGTYVERMWKRGEFRSPWIWSLIEVLKQLSGTVNARLMSSPSGGGSQRGVHNCGICDRAALDAIEKFSFTQDPKDLEVTCECKDLWKRYMEAEELLGTATDLDRGFDNDLMIRK